MNYYYDIKLHDFISKTQETHLRCLLFCDDEEETQEECNIKDDRIEIKMNNVLHMKCIVVWVFATYKLGNTTDDGDWSSQHIVGVCHVSPLPLSSYKECYYAIPILSHRNTEQGFLYLSRRRNVNKTLTPRPTIPLITNETYYTHYNTQTEHDIRSSLKHTSNSKLPDYEKLGTEDNEVTGFVSVYHCGKRIAVSAFLDALPPIISTPSSDVSCFQLWLDIAKSNVGMDTLPTEEAYHWTHYEVIGEMFTVIFKAMLYAADKVRSPKHKRGEYEDQWNSILTFFSTYNTNNTCGATVSYDCEDGMITVIQMITMFRQLKLDPHSELYRIQQWIQPEKYSLCGVLGRLSVAEGYVWHAYPALLDTEWLRNQEHGMKQPPIIMETTNYLQSCYSAYWTTSYQDKQNAFQQYCTLDKQFKEDSNNNSMRYVVHAKMPGTTVLDHHVYGPVHSIFTPNTNGQYQQFVCHTSDRIGVNPQCLFTGQTAGIQLYAVKPPSSREKVLLSIPVAPLFDFIPSHQQQLKPIQPNEMRIITRSQGDEDDDTKIETFLSKVGTWQKDHIQKIPLTTKMTINIYTLSI